MKFVSNKGKKINITVGKKVFKRHAIKTHFVQIGESYIDLIEKYVSPIYEEGDIVSISEKIISLCQGRVIKREDLKVGFLAKFLSMFASRPSTGVGVGESIKMQYAIYKVGWLKCIYAAIMSAITKLFGKKGKFYEIVGPEVSGLDGFYDHVWKEYGDIGIEVPSNPSGVCEEIYEKLKVKCMIVDANDLGQEIFGYTSSIKYTEKQLLGMIKDNPSGQSHEQTPLILIREVKTKKIDKKKKN